MQLYSAITDDDLNTIIRLLGALAESTQSLSQKRVTLIEGITRLIDADIWAWAGSRLTPDGALGPLYFHDGGYADARERELLVYYSSQPVYWQGILAQFNGREIRAICYNPNLPTSAPPEATALINYARKESHIPHLIYFTYPLDPSTTSVIGLHRRASKPPYSPRELAIVQLVFSQIEWLHRAGTDVAANSSDLDELTPRQRQVLIYLTTGRSRKQIASQMDISVHTVNEYCKDLYTHFAVNSAPELLAKFIGSPSSARRTPA